ncbi:MAG: bacteriohemerythrin [Treponema sp.]|nr:bacteriohemerythrin [Treponema sp.]
MKNFVEWEDRFSIGVPLIDSQHKQLIAATNELYKACLSNDEYAREQFRTTVREAVAYVKHHFSTEEQIMEKVAFPGMAEHKKIHAEFALEVLRNVEEFEKGQKFVPNQFVRFLKDWVLSHIAVIDIYLGNFIVDRQGMKQEGIARKPVILAVDDSVTQLEIIKTILPMYDVYTCDSPARALDIAKFLKIDIILLDISMPEMSGLELLHNLRNDPKYDLIPVVIISDRENEQYISKSVKFGSGDYVVKPVVPELLINKIKRLLDLNMVQGTVPLPH